MARLWHITLSVILCARCETFVKALTTPNNFMDDVLKSSLQYEIQLSRLDPFPVVGFKRNFQDHVMLIGSVKGTVEYTDGQLDGLSKVHRNSDCKGPFYGYDVAFFNCTIVFDGLQMSYRGKLKYGKLPQVTINAKANMTSTILYVDVMSYMQSSVPILRYFRFLQIGSVQTKFTGLGTVFNKYLKVLDNGFKEEVWPIFFNAIGQEFQFALSRAVGRVPLVWK